MLKIVDLEKRYNNSMVALHEINLEVQSGEVIGLIGHGDSIELLLTEEGARQLGLGLRTRFGFNVHPALHAVAIGQIEAMAKAGQSNVKLAR